MSRMALLALVSSLVAAAQSPFVQATGRQLVLNGQSFRFAGSNNYYLMYAPQRQIDEIPANCRLERLQSASYVWPGST